MRGRFRLAATMTAVAAVLCTGCATTGSAGAGHLLRRRALSIARDLNAHEVHTLLPCPGLARELKRFRAGLSSGFVDMMLHDILPGQLRETPGSSTWNCTPKG